MSLLARMTMLANELADGVVGIVGRPLATYSREIATRGLLSACRADHLDAAVGLDGPEMI